MDARFDPLRALGLRAGDAHIIRNAGGRASDDAIRSLVASCLLLGTTQVLVIHHTDCGMMAATNEDLRNEVRRRLGVDASGIDFMTFTDLEQSVRDDIESIRSSPFLPAELAVSGSIYDVRNGRLREVE